MHRAGCVGINFAADSGSDSFHRVPKLVMKSGKEWNPSLLFSDRVETARGGDIKDAVCGGGRRADGLAEVDHGEDLLLLRGGEDVEVPVSGAEVYLAIRNQG